MLFRDHSFFLLSRCKISVSLNVYSAVHKYILCNFILETWSGRLISVNLYCHYIKARHWMSSYSISYTADPGFKFCRGNQLRFLWFFWTPSGKCRYRTLRRHDCFLPHSIQFIIHNHLCIQRCITVERAWNQAVTHSVNMKLNFMFISLKIHPIKENGLDKMICKLLYPTYFFGFKALFLKSVIWGRPTVSLPVVHIGLVYILLNYRSNCANDDNQFVRVLQRKYKL